MPISSAKPTSRRGYLSQSELSQFADVTITDASEADDQISQAEEMIDSFVGAQKKAVPEIVTGLCSSAGGSDTLYLETDQQNVFQNDYFKGCEVEIIGGTGEGQRRRISASDYVTGKITVADNWTTAPDTTSFFKIYQLGKFPRFNDVFFDSEHTPNTYYKSIPEAVKRAVAAQVAFIIQMGDAFFHSDKIDKQSESIGDYSYSKGQGSTGPYKMIAPRAKLALRGIINRVGEIT